MAVFTLARSKSVPDGVRPFNALHHLRQVVKLVGAVFADEMDAGGRKALREMQLAGVLSPFLGGLLSVALFTDSLSGYVWIEAGRVVGNVTLQYADLGGTRWRISNVAVDPGYRGQGIAHALLVATLREVARRGGNWAVLQVRADNAIARHLYEHLGFTDVCQDGVWELASSPASPPPVPADVTMRPLRVMGWSERLDLARAAQSRLASWAHLVSLADYQIGLGRLVGELLGNLTGFYRVERWGVHEDGRLIGAVETHADSSGGAHRLRFSVHPEARGQLEEALVAQGLHSLAKAPPRPVVVEHSGDHAEGVAALETVGFRARRVLLTMRRRVVPGDVEL